MEHQEQDQWCWAAVSVSVAAFYNVAGDLSQCRMADAAFNLDTCCSDGGSDACNCPWYLDRALEQTRTLKELASGGLTNLSRVQAEIDSGHPVGVHIRWRGGNAGHFIVVEGCREDGGMFAIEDPWWGTSDLDVDTLVSNYQGTGEWDYTYYTGMLE